MSFSIRILFFWAVFSICFEDAQWFLKETAGWNSTKMEWNDHSDEDTGTDKNDHAAEDPKTEKDENITDVDTLMLFALVSTRSAVYYHLVFPSSIIQELESPPPKVFGMTNEGC